MKLTQAIILAGGLGTRLRSVVSDVPKPMADVNGRPFLECVINYLKKSGIKEIILATGHLHEKVESYFGDGSKFGVKVKYSRELQHLGTGGAVRLASKFVNGRFLLVNGDTWFGCDLDKLETWHEKNKSIVTIALAQMKNASRYGIVATNNENKITGFIEKEKIVAEESNKINSGYYVLEHEILNYIPEGTVSLEKDVFPKLAAEKKMSGILLHGNFIDIGVPEDYFKFKEFAKSFL